MFKKDDEQTMPSFTQKEHEVIEKIKEINNPEKIGSVAELGNIGYLLTNLENIVEQWEGLTHQEMSVYEILKEYNKKSEHAEYELSMAFINSSTEEEYKELEPTIYFYCGKVIDPEGNRGFVSEEDVETYLSLYMKSPEVLEDKILFIEQLKNGQYSF